jgi:copper chaperone
VEQIVEATQGKRRVNAAATLTSTGFGAISCNSDQGATMKTERLQVIGMTCGGCARTVERVLSALPGMSTVAVSLASNSVEVQYDESALNTNALRAALQSAGYELASGSPAPTRRSGCCG